MPPPGSSIARVLLLALGPFVVLLAALGAGRAGAIGTRVLPSPAVLAEERALHAAAVRGELPSWDPEHGAGRPLLPALARGAWSPLRATRALSEPERAAAWSAFLALVVLGFGVERFVARLVQRLRRAAPRSRRANALGLALALAAQACAFALGDLEEGAVVDALAFLPWAAWAALGLDRERATNGLVLASSVACAGLANAPGAAALVAGSALLMACATCLVRASDAERATDGSELPRASRAIVLVPRALAWILLGAAASAVDAYPRFARAHGALEPDETHRRAASEFARVEADVRGQEPAGETAHNESLAPGELLVRRPAADRVDVEVRGSSGGWLVFEGAFDPGWKAAIDGDDAEFVRVERGLRALRIPPGDSIARTKYEPFELRVGAWVSVLSALTIFGLALGARRRTAV
ncbi:MAG: hypothetical protein IPJ77_19920 [Planctomycetes bacterium]|nr:hypothetical protein [Planctomycetota bacterium]